MIFFLVLPVSSFFKYSLPANRLLTAIKMLQTFHAPKRRRDTDSEGEGEGDQTLQQAGKVFVPETNVAQHKS